LIDFYLKKRTLAVRQIGATFLLWCESTLLC